MKNAKFILKGYRFPKASIDLTSLKENNNALEIEISPMGYYHKETHEFDLKFEFSAKLNSNITIISVECEGEFVFDEALEFEEIPNYFFPNSIAIIFPYIRAFISTLSLQANYRPIIIPTMNLSDLSETLRQHVVVK